VEANRRQLALLGAILVVLAVVMYWQSGRRDVTPEEFSSAMSERAAAAAGPPLLAPQAAPVARRAGPVGIPGVALGSLGQAQPEPSDTGRDPFRFGSAAPSGVGGPRPGSADPMPAQPAATVMPAVPLEPPGPPPILLKFIGIAKQGEGRLFAVLRDDRGIYYGAEGDVVEGRFRILRVSAETIEVSYTDGRGRTSIPLSGGRP
jgi:hypothetical protein